MSISNGVRSLTADETRPAPIRRCAFLHSPNTNNLHCHIAYFDAFRCLPLNIFVLRVAGQCITWEHSITVL